MKSIITFLFVFLISNNCEAQSEAHKIGDQNDREIIWTFTGKNMGIISNPCKTDTIKGLLYRAEKYGGSTIDTGYYIAPCGGQQIGNPPISGMEYAPIWIPGIFLRNDQIDKNGKLVHKEFQQQYNSGYFTDAEFKKVQRSSVYGLLVFREVKKYDEL